MCAHILRTWRKKGVPFNVGKGTNFFSSEVCRSCVKEKSGECLSVNGVRLF